MPVTNEFVFISFRQASALVEFRLNIDFNDFQQIPWGVKH
jgi:hypothetical protein